VRYAFLCFALATVGCGDGVLRPDTGLATTVRLSQTSFRLGDRVAVTVILENTRDRTESITADDCFGTFVVLNSIGQQIGPGTARDCFASSPQVVLPPGRFVTFSEYWNGSMIPRASAAEFVTPGRYFVRGVLSGLVVDRTQSVSIDVLA
jgi:hypothetical protein